MNEKLYSVEEAAKALRYSERTIRGWCQTGKLIGAHRVGTARKWLIPKSAFYQSKTEQKAPKEARVEQKLGEEISHEQQTEEKGKLVALIQKWREEVASYSPVNLLQGWLDKVQGDATTRFYANEDVEMLYSEAVRLHAEPLRLKPFLLQVENDPKFGLVRQKFPASDVWTAFDAWHGQTIEYRVALFFMLGRVHDIVARGLKILLSEFREKGIEGVDWVDGVDLSGFVKRCKIESLLTVLVTCDLLASRIAELPSNSCWPHLTNDLKELRLRMNLELSRVTGITRKGGWSSGIMEIRAKSPGLPLELTQGLLDKLAEWQSTQDSLVKALKMLESRI